MAREAEPWSGSGYVRSAMVDDRSGVETYSGTHVYRYGTWFAWQFHICYT